MDEIRKEHSDEETEWLKGLQRESWHLELLVSGFAIFLLAQTPKLTGMLLVHVRASNSLYLVYGATPILRLVGDAAILLACCLVIHVAFRGIWIAMIGLESAFPQGIQSEKLGLSQWFQTRRKQYNGLASIRKLDDSASSIFAFSLLMVGNLISICVLFCVIILIGIAAEQNQGVLSWMLASLELALVCAILLKLLNIFSGGLFSRIERISRFYYPIDRMIALLSLSFFYQPVFDFLATNLSKRMVTGLVCTFIGIILIYEFKIHDVHTAGAEYRYSYDDQRPAGYITRGFSIQSDMIDSDVLKVFLPLSDQNKKIARKDCPDLMDFEFQGVRLFGDDLGLGSQRMDWRARNEYLDCVKRQYRFHLNDTKVEPSIFQFISKEESGLLRQGFLAYLQLPESEYGPMSISVQQQQINDQWIYLNRVDFWRIKNQTTHP